MASCLPAELPAPQRAELAVGIGIESLQDPATDWEAVANWFEAARVGALCLSVGRPEWTAFPWPGRSRSWAAQVTAEHDRVEAALSALTGSADRRVTLTVDVLSPARIEEVPELGGVFADGVPSSSFPAATALQEGTVGEEVVELCGEIARRYRPDRIALTELMADAFFSAADEELFTRMTASERFPRQGGLVDMEDRRVSAWQSEIITSLISRCADAARPHGVGIEMDARIHWESPGQDRPDSGHLYEEILATGAHLTLWAYTGLHDADPALTAELAGALERRFTPQERARLTISVGLWESGGRALTAPAMATSIDGAARGIGSVLVTPLSLLGREHRRAMPKLSGW